LAFCEIRSIRGRNILNGYYSLIKSASGYLATGAFLCITFPSSLLAASEYNNQTEFQPFETRDQNLFNLIHGQALPTNAKLNQKSQSRWASSLAITNTVNIETATAENIYLDYEAYRFNFSYQYGLSDQWDLKLDVPIIYQSGGVFDSAIDQWHAFFNLPEGKRPLLEHDQYDVRYSDNSQTAVNLNEASSSLGDIQIALARTLIENDKTTISLWGSVKLPTGSEDKLTSNGASDFSAWLAVNQQLSKNWVMNMNGGAVILGANSYKNIPLADYAIYGHVMLGWLASENISLKVQLQGHTSYYPQSQLNILGDTYLLSFGGSIKINQCNQVDVAFSEDIKVEASPDISLLINWRNYPSAC